MARWITIGSWVVLGVAASPLAHADATSGWRLDKLAPQTVFAKPTHERPKIEPARVVPENIRAVATLYAISAYERAGVFAAGQRLVADYQAKKLVPATSAKPALDKLVSAHQAAPAAAERGQFVQFVADLLKEQFSALVESSTQQMDAYSALVSAVAASVDEFTSDNASDNSERDFLQAQALATSNAGYAAAHYAAARISPQAHEITHVVQQASIQKAYGAKSAADLIAKLSGRSPAQVERELARAKAGSQLLLWLRHAAKPTTLAARAKQEGIAKLAARLQQLAMYEPAKPRKNPKLPKVRALCLPPGATKPRAC